MAQLKRDNKHLLEDISDRKTQMNIMTKEIETYADNETKMKRTVFEAERDVKLLNKQVSQLNARLNGFAVADDVIEPEVNIDIKDDDDDNTNDNDNDNRQQPENTDINTINNNNNSNTNNNTNSNSKSPTNRKPKGFQSLASQIKAEEDEKKWAVKQKEANDLALADHIRELDNSAKEKVTATLASLGPVGLVSLINDNLKLEHMVSSLSS